ncbi:MAG: single-stranded DNA-binding protein [Verrucomicrobia bacterium]|nr:single-stranded DNA-binding protein [Verrucomicrobiota bacterium]
MANFNRVILAGNLTRDPDLRYSSKGVAVAKLGLAINRTWKTETGETREETTFVDVDAFGRQAEVIGQYLKKGRPILMEGRLKYDTWDDKQSNQKRSRLTVVLESFQFMDSQRSGDASAPAAPRPRPAAPTSAAPTSAAPASAVPGPGPAAAGAPGEPESVSEPDGPPPDDDVPF